MHGVVLRALVLLRLGQLVGIDDARTPRLGVFFDDALELADDDVLQLFAAVERGFQAGDVPLQLLRLRRALEDVLAVDVAQPDLGHIFGLHAVDAEAVHQVRHHVRLAFGVADDGDGLVDVEQYLPQALQQVQLLALALQVEEHAPADAFRAPGGPLAEYLAHAHHARVALDKYIEVAGEGVHQRRQAEKFRHQLFRLRPALEVDGQLEAAEVGLVAHVGDLLHLAGLHQLGHLVHHGLGRGGVGQLVDLDDVCLFVMAPARADAEAAAARAVYLRHGGAVHDDLPARGEVRGGQRGHDVVPGVAHELDGRLTHFAQVEAAYLARHADGDARVGGDEDVGESRGQQRRLLHGAVVVVHEVHGLLVDVGEELGADGRELRLRITGGGAGHVARIYLAEVALGVHERRQHRAVAL